MACLSKADQMEKEKIIPPLYSAKLNGKRETLILYSEKVNGWRESLSYLLG